MLLTPCFWQLSSTSLVSSNIEPFGSGSVVLFGESCVASMRWSFRDGGFDRKQAIPGAKDGLLKYGFRVVSLLAELVELADGELLSSLREGLALPLPHLLEGEEKFDGKP